ncbi:MAG: hypothetical protein M1831_000850 [Alyxoria varia]|nr:MAG: hypothetical protein M1831_000850 [Alyxoria varia]
MTVAIGVVAVEFEVGYVVSTLGVSLFVLGFVFGPIVFGPLSEVYGRKRPLFIGYVSFAIFQIPVAVAQNLETVMISRFLGGFAACAPLAIIGGALADMWDPIERAYAICAFAFGVFVGPVAGPIAGGFITESHLGWRWTAWLTLIMASTFGAIGFFVIPETSAARILQDRARDLRYSTKNWALHAKADESRTDAKAIAFIYLLRPFRMIVQEPILLLMTLYMSFVYGMLYLFFEAYPIAFVEIRGWSLGTGALPFAAFIAGVAIGSSAIAYSTAYHFAPSYKANDNRSVPEERLPPMIFGGVLLPVGLFWFAWTSDPGIHWISQVLASAVISIGCITSFWQGMNYIIDCYGFYSNSAIAVNTFIRSIAGAGFPLFAPAMYHNLGVDWATSVLGFLTLAFAPMPVLFYIYGARSEDSNSKNEPPLKYKLAKVSNDGPKRSASNVIREDLKQKDSYDSVHVLLVGYQNGKDVQNDKRFIQSFKFIYEHAFYFNAEVFDIPDDHGSSEPEADLETAVKSFVHRNGKDKKRKTLLLFHYVGHGGGEPDTKTSSGFRTLSAFMSGCVADFLYIISCCESGSLIDVLPQPGVIHFQHGSKQALLMSCGGRSTSTREFDVRLERALLNAHLSEYSVPVSTLYGEIASSPYPANFNNPVGGMPCTAGYVDDIKIAPLYDKLWSKLGNTMRNFGLLRDNQQLGNVAIAIAYYHSPDPELRDYFRCLKRKQDLNNPIRDLIEEYRQKVWADSAKSWPVIVLRYRERFIDPSTPLSEFCPRKSSEAIVFEAYHDPEYKRVQIKGATIDDAEKISDAMDCDP